MSWNSGARSTKRYGLTFLWIFLLTAADQLSKIMAESALKNQGPIVLIPDIFQLEYLENQGAAFGILQNQRQVFFIITVLALIGLTFLYIRIPNKSRYRPMRGCYILFTAGAAGNFIDRVMQGYVIDFFYFKWIDFPIFNVADIYVTAAVILLLVLILFYYDEEELDFVGRKK